MRWIIQAEHEVHEGDEKCIRNFWLGSLKEGNHSEGLRVGGRIILKWMLGRIHTEDTQHAA
jgi:hypothetical protein